MDTPLASKSPDNSGSRQAPKRLTATVALIALLSIPGLLVVVSQRAMREPVLRRGDRIPQLTLPGLNSDNLSLADLRGKRVALFFFNVTCARCQRELFSVARLSSLFKSQITVVAISLSDPWSTAEFLRANQVRLYTLVDARAEARQAFGIEEVPVLILVGADQTVEHQFSGEVSFQTLRKRLMVFGRGGDEERGESLQD